MEEFNILDFDKKHVKKEKKENKFAKFLKAVFIHNLGYKLLALGTGIVVWLLLLL